MKEIKLTRGQVTLVDDEDYVYLNQWRWYAFKGRNTFYAARLRYKDKKLTLMHRVIMQVSEGQEVDHVDHDGLNNQKYNLRKCTHKENSANKKSRKNSSSKYLGVTITRTGKFAAQIMICGKHIHLGLFKDEKDAAESYNIAAKSYFKEFANINKIIR
jgi:hypothetical protein